MTLESAGSLKIPGLDQEDTATLLNARNFEYYCEMIERIRKNECPFCDPLDPTKNQVTATIGNTDSEWRVWECPASFRAKNLLQHYVIAPRQHRTDLGKLSAEDFRALWMLVVTTSIKLSGDLLEPHFGDETIGFPGVYGYVVVPNGRQKVEVTFSDQGNSPATYSKLKICHQAHDWACCQVPVSNGLESKFLIGPGYKSFKSFGDLTYKDFDNVSAIIATLTDMESGFGLPGGAFVMGLPGAALVMRFGEVKRNAGSIRHLHCNIMVPDATKRVQATLAKDAGKVAEKLQVLHVWEKMRLIIESHPGLTKQEVIQDLTQEERDIIKNRE